MQSFVSPVVDRKIRLGLIGCGRISAKHFDAIECHCRDLELVAVCDVDHERAAAAAQRMGCKVYTSLEAMLGSERMDLVSVASPNGMHPKHVMQVADHKVHALTEKPMAVQLEDGVAMLKHCNDRSVQLFVVHQNRFNATVEQLCQAKKVGRFGKIYMIVANVFWSRPQSYYERKGDWHGSKRLDGGAFYTQASHHLDLMTLLADSDLQRVYARLATFDRKIETEDCGIADIEWTNGILGSINVTVLAYPDNLEGSITVIGEKGSVQLGGVALNKIVHWAFAEPATEDENIKNFSYETHSVYGCGHLPFYGNLVNVFRGTEQPVSDGRQGLASLRLLSAIHAANTSGREVRL